jgi:hypothetical protein
VRWRTCTFPLFLLLFSFSSPSLYGIFVLLNMVFFFPFFPLFPLRRSPESLQGRKCPSVDSIPLLPSGCFPFIMSAFAYQSSILNGDLEFIHVPFLFFFSSSYITHLSMIVHLFKRLGLSRRVWWSLLVEGCIL